MRFSGKPHRNALLVVATAMACLTGCQSETPGDRVAVTKVSGSVLFRGKSAEGAQVVLHPTATTNSTAAVYPNGTVASDGQFQLTSYEQNDGAPVGSYSVTIVWPDTDYKPKSPLELEEIQMGGSAPDKLRGRYANPASSTINVTITGEENQVLEPIEVQ